MELYKWQAQELERHWTDRKRAIFASPRVGKTRCAIACMAEAADHCEALRNVVVAPLVVCPMWVEQLSSAGFDVSLGYQHNGPLPDEGTVVINWDRLARRLDDLTAWKPQYLIADESHKAKGVSSDRGRAFRRLAWKTEWVRLLTGTPAPNHYGDLWGQMVALNKDDWGRSYESFARRYLIRDSMFPSRVLGYTNVEELQAKLLRYATIVRREDVFGPDTWQEVIRPIKLSPAVKALYTRLARQWVAELGDGREIDATHVLKRLVRLQQIASGYTVDELKEAGRLHTHKIDAVLADLDEIREAGEKAAVFYRFVWEREEYARELKVTGHQVFIINGDNWQKFQAYDGPAVAVAQTQSCGIGISLNTAVHALFVSCDFSFADHIQARDRVYKPGQSRCVTYYLAEGTVDYYIKKVLDTKGDVFNAVRNADFQSMAFGG